MSFETGFLSVANEDEAIAVVRHEPSIISSLPDSLLTDNVLFEALSRDLNCYKLVHTSLLSNELIQRLILDNANAIEYIPKGMINKEHYLEMVKQNGLTIQKIPSYQRTKEICVAAVINNSLAHFYVPENVQDSEYIGYLIRSNPDYVREVDIHQRDVKLLQELVVEHTFLLLYMAMPDRTKEICLKVMEKDHSLIEYFPENVYNDSEVLEAISNLDIFTQRTEMFKENLVRRELAEYMFKKDKDVYRLLPLHSITLDIAREAIEYDYRNIYGTPSYLKQDGKLWELAMLQNEDIYSSIPINERSDQLRIFIARKESSYQSQLKDKLKKIGEKNEQDKPE